MRCKKCKTTQLCNKCTQSCDKCNKTWCSLHWTGRQYSHSIWLCGRCKKTKKNVVSNAIHSSHKTCLFQFLQRKRDENSKCIDCMPELFFKSEEAQGVVMLEFIKRTRFPNSTRICREEYMLNILSSWPQQYDIFKSPWHMYLQSNKKTHVVLCSIMYVQEWDQTLTSFGLYKL